MTLNPNQFEQDVVKGGLDQSYNPHTISCRISANETETLVRGSPVKIEDSVGGVPNVLLATADTDNIYGFVVRNLRKSSFEAGDEVEIACFGNYMYMEAGAAIARGAAVVADVSEAKVLTAAGTVLPVIGFAFDKASGDESLIRVFIMTPMNLTNGYFADLIIPDDVSITDDLNVSGAVTIGETLAVTGAVTLSSTLEVNGDITLENDETISNAVDGTVEITSNIIQHSFDAAAYWTATQADGGGVTFASVSDGTAGFTFSQDVTFSANIIKSHTDYSAGAGALPLTTDIIFLTTGGAEALTLADGVAGQSLIIVMVSDGGDGTVTPANYLNGTTLTFDDVGDSAHLVFDGTNWCNVGTPTATVA